MYRSFFLYRTLFLSTRKNFALSFSILDFEIQEDIDLLRKKTRKRNSKYAGFRVRRRSNSMCNVRRIKEEWTDKKLWWTQQPICKKFCGECDGT